MTNRETPSPGCVSARAFFISLARPRIIDTPTRRDQLLSSEENPEADAAMVGDTAARETPS